MNLVERLQTGLKIWLAATLIGTGVAYTQKNNQTQKETKRAAPIVTNKATSKYIATLENNSPNKSKIQSFNSQLVNYDTYIREEYTDIGLQYATSITTNTYLSPKNLERKIAKDTFNLAKIKIHPFQRYKNESEAKKTLIEFFDAIVKGDADKYLSFFTDPFYSIETGKAHKRKLPFEYYKESFAQGKDKSNNARNMVDINKVKFYNPKELKKLMKDIHSKYTPGPNEYGLLGEKGTSRNRDLIPDEFISIMKKTKKGWKITSYHH